MNEGLLHDWKVLHIIRKNPQTTVEDLMKAFSTDKDIINKVLDELVEKGKIHKCESYYIK